MSRRISVVVAVRNDGYGGDFVGRFQNFLDVLDALDRRFQFCAELIVVEWNPPADREPFAHVIQPPAGFQVPTRVITVPAHLHAQLESSESIPLFEFAAKNVGVRRAVGDFVLATNPDILFRAPTAKWLARASLNRGSFYRADRYDVRVAIPEGSAQGRVRFCDRNIWRANIRGYSVTFDRPPRFLSRVPPAMDVYLRSRRPEGVLRDAPSSRLHLNGSGDFLLMHTDAWKALRGYPELPKAGHLDAYLCVMAKSAGMSEHVLSTRSRIYHQEHERAVDWSAPERSTRPLVSYEQFESDAMLMLKGESSLMRNDDGWGLGGEDLPETVIATA